MLQGYSGGEGEGKEALVGLGEVVGDGLVGALWGCDEGYRTEEAGGLLPAC